MLKEKQVFGLVGQTVQGWYGISVLFSKMIFDIAYMGNYSIKTKIICKYVYV